MKLFILNDHVIKEIINSLTIEEEIKDIILNVIHQYDYSLVNFIYDMFSVYAGYYVNPLNENSYIPPTEAQQIFTELSSRINPNIDRNNVFVADIYDILFFRPRYEKSPLNGYFYEDIYNRLENIIGTDQAFKYAEEIFDALEDIFYTVEEDLIQEIIQNDEYSGNVIIYLELKENKLMVYVFQFWKERSTTCDK